jgi:hypothetical protein
MLRRIFAAAVVASAALACTSSNTGTTSSGDTADSGPTVSCDKDSRVDTYVANLEKKSANGALTATLVASDPAPPIRGTNTWTLKLVDATGKPVTSDVTITPFMPDHGHGTSVKPTPTAQPDGTWKIDNLYFFMPGVWRITIQSGADSVEYFFCVDG